MAEYYFEFGFVSRSGGGKSYSKNSIAKAAYDSREKLTDERTGEVYDYRWKGLPEWSGIFLPEEAPKWMRNRQELWNGLEKREDRSTRPESAQPSRTWKIGIPKEFDTPEKRERFVIDYGRTLSRTQGYLADLSIHAPDGDSRNYHIHAQLALREVAPDGFGKKIRLWDSKKGINREEEMTKQKENLVNLAARHLERYGHQLEADRFRHSHKTLKVQMAEAAKRGDHEFAVICDREPTIHMGPAASAMEKKGVATRKGDRNAEIEARNAERLAQHKIDQILQNLPPGLRVPVQLERYAVPIWLALAKSTSPQAFQDNLKKDGWQLARVNEEDAFNYADRSRVSEERSNGAYVPKLREGDYVAVNPRGQAFFLNEKTTGRSFQEMKRFTAELDKEAVISLLDAENVAKARTRNEIDGRPTGRLGRKTPGREKRMGVVRKASKALGFGIDTGIAAVSLLGAVFDPVLTPEQKIQRDKAEAKRKIDGQHKEKKQRAQDDAAIRRRNESERER